MTREAEDSSQLLKPGLEKVMACSRRKDMGVEELMGLVREKAKRLIIDERYADFDALESILQIDIDLPKRFVNDRYDALLRKGRVNSAYELRRVSGVEPDISYKARQKLLMLCVRDGIYDSLPGMFEFLETDVTSVFVDRAVRFLARRGRLHKFRGFLETLLRMEDDRGYEVDKPNFDTPFVIGIYINLFKAGDITTARLFERFSRSSPCFREDFYQSTFMDYVVRMKFRSLKELMDYSKYSISDVLAHEGYRVFDRNEELEMKHKVGAIRSLRKVSGIDPPDDLLEKYGESISISGNGNMFSWEESFEDDLDDFSEQEAELRSAANQQAYLDHIKKGAWRSLEVSVETRRESPSDDTIKDGVIYHAENGNMGSLRYLLDNYGEKVTEELYDRVLDFICS